MHRHLRSLRRMKIDQGWIHTLLEEAENERIHLLTFLKIKKTLIIIQNWGSFSYLVIPISSVLKSVIGLLDTWKMWQDGSPPIHQWTLRKANHHSIEYWGLEDDATLFDVVKGIRKDEEHHKDINHFFADDYTQFKQNSFPPGK
ncbi:unnamed protein product (macronuclear) [Paramecium tetraurelia]|uniref:Alternative oxidase n=1 Tax=Paramecium tetraurelia TaxID=5888 RepID=A0D6S0_PARTE|nr:uncharacterized protein GSPATT00001778001 [Paramecium tetraurelia]CAK78737.1 unnamed protein product [Paramecium tetraurelia]|eukprot:XP_001446134.1 hypothetical protein (macronuclear) [Paramecium tetraurelia strain d4-2]